MAAILEHYGLPPRVGLRLGVLPRGATAGSLRFAAAMAAFAAREGGRALWLSREPRYAARALRLGGDLVVEAHGLRGRAPLEAAGLRAARGLVVNSEGTLRRLRRRHAVLPPTRVVSNACRGAGPALRGVGEGIGYVGSLRADKGVGVLERLAAVLDEPVVVVTPEAAEARRRSRRWQVEEALPYRDVPARLARFRVLVLCLAHGAFGDEETCPLKWFDYAASGRPVVVADTAAMRRLAPGWVPRFTPGDVPSLHQAIEACEDPALRDRFAQRPLVRTWADRAAEVDAFLRAVAP